MIGAYWLSEAVSNRKILARDRKRPGDESNDALVFIDKTDNSLEDVITPM
jgi:hypothetical protein